jgi:tripartite-type tricarboxylate transporter receptor subunit TctC
MVRTYAVGALLAAMAASMACLANAQGVYPVKPIRIIVPFGPG